jgi:hypothetical protein
MDSLSGPAEAMRFFWMLKRVGTGLGGVLSRELNRGTRDLFRAYPHCTLERQRLGQQGAAAVAAKSVMLGFCIGAERGG